MKYVFPILLTLALFFAKCNISAQSVSIKTAGEIAAKHLLASDKGNLKSSGTSQVKYRFSTVSIAEENKDTLYYVLNDTINNSFVIVAADKRAWPILGYSCDGIYNQKKLPPAFIEWMEDRKKEIKNNIKNNLKSDKRISQQWENLSSPNTYLKAATISVEPLLQTKWNQGCYYNTLCPSDAAGPCGHAVTGCVATSMAQIMKYWNYPTTGTGSHLYSHPVYGTLSANFGATTYQWSQMTNSLTIENEAVATLMYHCGVSVNMNYGPGGSGAGVSPNPLVNYFGYSANAQSVIKNNYSETGWTDLLKSELDAFRPVWYSGNSTTAGHAFVCDGYQGTDYFHFNWGWGGYEDGYFYLGSIEFNSYQAAVIKIYPGNLPNGYKGFLLSTNLLSLGATSDVDSVKILSSVDWNTSSDQSWLSVNPVSGISGSTRIILAAAENNTGSPRSAIVTVSATGYNSQTIIVNQTYKVTVLPGTLKSALASVLSTTTALTLTGSIDARDFKTMRDDMPLLSKVDLSGVVIVAYTGTEGTAGTNNIIYPANAVPIGAFQSKEILESVKLPASITLIDSDAFSFCTGLKTVNIPFSVTSIYAWAFIGSSAWISVDINNTAYSGQDGVLFNKAKTELIFCPVTKTGNYEIPPTVSSIGRYAFYYCEDMVSIAIPYSVTIINSNSFTGFGGSFTVDPGNPNYSGSEGVLYNKLKTTLIQCPVLKTGNFTVPPSVTRIENSAFFRCVGLTGLTIPTTVTFIGSFAFYSCTGLTSFSAFPVSPVNLGSSFNVFDYIKFTTCTLKVPFGSGSTYKTAAQWSSFITISEMPGIVVSANNLKPGASAETIPVKVSSSAGWSVTSDQSWLTTVPASGISGITDISILVTANPGTTPRNAKLTFTATGYTPQTVDVTQSGKIEVVAGKLKEVLGSNISITENLTLSGTIDARDFKTMRDDMPSLTKIDLGSATIVTYTGTEGTYSTSSRTYPANAIPDRAFYNTVTGLSKTELVSVTLNSSVTAIGLSAFYRCSGLSSFNLPNSLTSIGSQAFYFCTGLKTISVPFSVTSISTYAFTGSSGWITVDETNPNYSSQDGILFNKTKTSLIQCPVSKNGSCLIPSSVTSIGAYAFMYCTGLTSISIPSIVTSIGTYAFYDCTGLNYIKALPVVPVNLSSSTGVFNYVNKSTCTLYVPVGSKSAYQSASQWQDFLNISEIPMVELSANSVTLKAFQGSTTSVSISSNTNWLASSDKSWLAVSPGSGTGNGVITLTAEANPGDTVRMAKITVLAAGIDPLFVTVIQENAQSIATQIVLNTGWNIASFINIPVNPDIKNIFLPMINDGSLIKIQDENGNSLEDMGVFGGWMNNIGNISFSEGYKIKVTRNCQLSFSGIQTTLPVKIPLKIGWNIIGFPYQSDANAQAVVQQLIDRGTLVKVQDDQGNSIEDWGLLGGWVNNIGNFMPGEGYKIKVNATDTLTIYDSYTKSSSSPLSHINPVHFKPATTGNGVDHMNINLVNIPEGLLQEGDEIGVFDGNLCVGSVKCSRLRAKSSGLSMAVTANDGIGDQGFKEGNPFTLKIWKVQTNKEYLVEPEILKGTTTFLKHESTLVSLANSVVTRLGDMVTPDKVDLKIYPNPTDGKIYISARNVSLKGSKVQVFNTLGQVILNRIIDSDPDEIIFSGHSSGLYYIYITGNSWSKTEKILLK